MSTYPNGKIPEHLLIRRGPHLLTAGTWAKWDALVDDVQERFGVTLRISQGSTELTRGSGAYRIFPIQVAVKKYWCDRGQCNMAATPGRSSHGGEFNGEDALAIDVNNYTDIPLSEFRAACRRAGFEPDYFDGIRHKPYEPWHIIDRDPYRKLAAPAGGETPIPAAPEEEDEPMTGRFTYKRSDGKTVRVVHGEAYFEEHTDETIKNADINLSLNLPQDAPWPAMPESYRDNVYNATLAVRTAAMGVHRAP